MPPLDPFALSIQGVSDLIENKINKVPTGLLNEEGVESEKFDALDLPMSDEELLKLRDDYEKRYAPYEAILKPRVKKIYESYTGKRGYGQWLTDTEIPLAANLQFEAMETFLAAALAKNPEPVVYCDNTQEGNAIADAVKTMLEFHADQLVIRRKLTMMVRQWGMSLLGVLKPGWNSRINDVTIDNRKIQDYIFDPNGYVDAYGDFSSWYGERITVTAEKLIEEFPKKKAYIELLTDGKMGTECVYTEWWPNDEYCFYSFKNIILDKHKNQFWKYADEGQVDPMTGQPVQPRNHFAYAKKPAIFLSVFSLQEHPHDITSLVEQNITTQNLITRETEQIDYNIAASNNGYAFSEDNFNQETGKQAWNARRSGRPILVPSGGPIDKAIFPLPAQTLPEAFFSQVEVHKNDLRSSWGIQGISSQPPNEEQTARGMILDQSHDSTRIGGGIGDAIEQVADNVFNWLTQLYYVFYDEKHFAAVMGQAKAVEYVTLSSQDMTRQLIVSVAPDSTKPRDDISLANEATELFQSGAIGPKTLLAQMSFPDPDESASDGVLYKVDPQAYLQLNWPELAQQLQQAQQQAMAQQQQQEQAVAQQQMQQQGAQAGQQLQQKEQAHQQKMSHSEQAFQQKQEQAAQPPTTAAPASSASLKNVPLPPK